MGKYIKKTFLLGYLNKAEVPKNLQKGVQSHFEDNSSSESGYDSLVVGDIGDAEFESAEIKEFLLAVEAEAQKMGVKEILFVPR